MSALMLYGAVATAILSAVHRWITPISRHARLALFILPLLVTGRALFTGGVYGPIDLSYDVEPLSSLAADIRINPLLTNPTMTDVQRLMIPWKAAVRHAIAHGEWPLLNPFMSSGDILLAASEPSPFHPANALSYILPIAAGVTFHAAITLLCAGLAAFLFARELELGEPASLIAAAGWMFSSFLLFYLQVPLGSAVLLQPILFLSVRRVVLDKRIRDAALLALILALLILAGHPESTLHVTSLGLAYGVFWLIRKWSMRAVAAASAAAVVALLLTAVQILPFVEALRQSSDYVYRVNTWSRERPSSTIARSLELLVADAVPFAFGSPAREQARVPADYHLPYSGYAGSLLFAPAIVALRRWRTAERWFLFGLVIFGFLAGVSAPGVTGMLARLPLFSISINERLAYAGVLGVVMLAAAGVDLFLAGRDRVLPVTSAVVFLILAAAVAALWQTMLLRGLPQAFLSAAAARELVPLALATALLLQRAPMRVVATAYLALLLMQRAAEDGRMTPTLPVRALYPRPPLLAGLPQTDEPYRVVGYRSAMTPNLSAHFALEDPRGFQGLAHAGYADLIPLWSRRESVSSSVVDDLSRPFLNFLNVRYAVADANDPRPANWRKVSEFRGGVLLENPRVIERAFIPRRVAFVSSRSQMPPMLRTAEFADIAWIDPLRAGQPQVSDNGSGTLRTRRDGSALRIDAELDAPAWIVISQTAWKGWRAFIDDREAPLHVANVAFLAVSVPAGRHVVTLQYRPFSFVIGGTISAATVLVLLAAALLRRRGRVRA